MSMLFASLVILPILQFFNKRFFSVEEILPLLPSSNNEQFPQIVI